MDDRFTIANMAIEAGGKNGIFPVDDTAKAYLNEHTKKSYHIYEADQDAEYEEIIDKSAKSNKLAEIAAKAAGVKDHPRPEQPTDQTQDYANNKPTRKSLL